MDKDGLAKRLMATFVVELADHVHTFEQNLLALEAKPERTVKNELLKTLLRTAHSLKGAARSVQMDIIETASHRLEEIFAAARDGRLQMDAAFFALLLPAVDAIGESARRLGNGTGLAGAPLEDIVRQLAKFAASQPDRGSIARPVEAAEAPPPATREQRLDVVRVSTEKLDTLLRQNGELLIVRHRAEARSEEVAELQRIVADWRKKDWQRVERGVTALLKQSTGSDEEPVNGGATESRAGIQGQVERALSTGKDGLWRLERALQRLVVDLATDRRMIEQAAAPLDATVRQTRMLPFAEACEGLKRMARDLTVAGDKKVSLIVEGGEIELDRSVLEGVKDPLMHLVRNAIDHGIESTVARRAVGKPEFGQVTVMAALRGSRVEITVSDDGKGLDIGAIREQLGNKGLPQPEDDQELVRSIFLSGFSTSSVVTQLSGRGVGLDVVKTKLAAMRGTVDVTFKPDQGTRFTLGVPLTLTSIRAVLAEVGGRLFAVDTTSLHSVVRISSGDIRSIGGREMLLLADVPIPVVDLAAAIGLPVDADRPNDNKRPALVLTAGNRLAAVTVDSLQAEREVVVRALGPRLTDVRYVAGGTLLPDGKIALILNAGDLVDRAVDLAAGAGIKNSMAVTPLAIRKRLLVVDDSATIRTLVKSILEAAGYDVMIATDGEEAWQLLLQAGVDLVVSDVEMPRMDGFALTEAIRGSKRFQHLPVILVTARESDADKAHGMAVGADAYCVKSAFDQKDLLVTIKQIL